MSARSSRTAARDPRRLGSAAVVVSRTGSRAAVPQKRAPAPAASCVAEERADTLLVGERRQSRRLPRRDPQRAAASNQTQEERLRSLRAHCSLRSLRRALVSRCLPHSLAAEERGCSLDRPGQRRASLLRAAARDSRRSQLATFPLTSAEQLGATHEICITSRKTRVQLVRIGLHPVTNPLLFRLRPPFEVKTRASSSRRSPTCTAAEAGLGEPVVVRGDLECPARRRKVRARVAP